MRVIDAENVNDAYQKGLYLLRQEGILQESRAGDVLATPYPVVTCYRNPVQRVLFDSVRDANPFFMLYEALWMLAGRNDGDWLDQFVSDFSTRFAEEDGRIHGAYGHRWRHHFDVEGGGRPGLPDQLETIIQLLRANPLDRRIVLTMWDPVADLAADMRDHPCNTQAYFRLRPGGSQDYARAGVKTDPMERNPDGSDYHLMNAVESTTYLDLTVCCRSNDIVWGAYGANAVHFSVLQEYMAGRLGARVGTYYQISNNFHGYVDVLDRLGPGQEHPDPIRYPRRQPLGQDWSSWDKDLHRFMAWTESEAPDQQPQTYPNNPWFHETAEPIYVAHRKWKCKERGEAMEILSDYSVWPHMAPDWRVACYAWCQRRINRAKEKSDAKL